MEDLGGIPQYRDSLHASPDLEVNTIVKTTGASSLTNEIADLLNKNVENDENAFAKKTYSMVQQPEVQAVDAIEFFAVNIEQPVTVEEAIEFF